MSWGAHECPTGTTATASKWQLNVKDFPTKRRQPDVSSRHHAVCQASLGVSTFATAGRFRVYARALLPAEPWAPGTHCNWLSRLAPGLHPSNAWRPQPPDVTFPADTGKNIHSVSLSCRSWLWYFSFFWLFRCLLFSTLLNPQLLPYSFDWYFSSCMHI